MSNQYDVLGKAPGPEELKKLSPDNNHVTIKNLSAGYGKMEILHDFDLCDSKSQSLCLICTNGAGKSTILNSIVGTYPIDGGSIKFNDREVSELPVPVIAKLGLLRTFQQTRIYGKLNCIQNMLISHKPENDGILTVFQKIPSDLTDKAETLLKFVGLHQKRKLRAGDLSFGQQKLLELAMALMNEPKMLLLDEPTAGINPTLINGIIDRLISVNKDYGITLLVIEHNMKVIMNLAQRVFCLAHGQMLANGTPDEIKNDKRVLDAYLGAQ
jgi:branched-chain amino acid transport system ATP-binding protein